jgi:hypothetical protein
MLVSYVVVHALIIHSYPRGRSGVSQGGTACCSSCRPHRGHTLQDPVVRPVIAVMVIDQAPTHTASQASQKRPRFRPTSAKMALYLSLRGVERNARMRKKDLDVCTTLFPCQSPFLSLSHPFSTLSLSTDACGRQLRPDDSIAEHI